MSTSEPPVYRLENVTKRLARAGSMFTLRVPALTIERGEFVAFVGQSGCGKSTLLDLLGLVSTPTAADRFDVAFCPGDPPGPIASAGEPWLAGLRRRHLGYVLQDGGLLPFLTVGDNILLARRVNGLEVGGNAEGPGLARALGIEAQWNKKPAFLSGGQRQRVAIARALAHRPVVLLADEPTGAVDKLTANGICDLLLATARERRATVMMVTHDESLLAGRAPRVFTFQLEQTASNEVVSTLVATRWEERAGNTGGLTA